MKAHIFVGFFIGCNSVVANSRGDESEAYANGEDAPQSYETNVVQITAKVYTSGLAEDIKNAN